MGCTRKDGRPDLVRPGRRVAIFVHGCFWHRHPDPDCKLARLPKSRLEFWIPKLEGNRARDERKGRARSAWLESLRDLGVSDQDDALRGIAKRIKRIEAKAQYTRHFRRSDRNRLVYRASATAEMSDISVKPVIARGFDEYIRQWMSPHGHNQAE
ncbi:MULTISPECIES: very short patch repair endonuclease [Bradyrhizobium]|uniref:very short patch repair endonuclease n=1 Tax=Bradyrhizobium TaxID=374 RepID=UPI001EDAE65B|nr:very short patch repair endonuclease [Bradyrhizobium zhengyangense]